MLDAWLGMMHFTPQMSIDIKTHKIVSFKRNKTIKRVNKTTKWSKFYIIGETLKLPCFAHFLLPLLQRYNFNSVNDNITNCATKNS